jgi:hypothetical protein
MCSVVLTQPNDEQTQWITNALQNKPPQVYWTSAVYHAPLYPSSRDPNAEPTSSLRALWEPIFNQYNLRIAFENHDHAYKRSYLIRNNTVHIYLSLLYTEIDIIN